MDTGNFAMIAAGEIAWEATDGLRISYLLPQFPVPTQPFAQSDMAALTDAGHDVSVYTVKPPRPCAQAGTGAEKISIFRPTLRGGMRWPALLWRMRRSVFSLIREILPHALTVPRTVLTALFCIPRAVEIVAEIEGRQTDVVHLFWARHASLVLAMLKTRRFKGVSSAFVGAYDLVADDFLVHMAMQSADVVFSHAEANRSFLEAKVPAETQTEIIHRGIPLTELDETIARDPKLWVTASALVPAKNVEGVLRAFAHARQHRPGLALQIFGEGRDRQRLDACCHQLDCAGAVHFMGHVGRSDLFAAMQRADTFLLLSEKPSERLPNVVKEALWAGCAVISSNSEGITELIPDEAIGRVVDAGNDEAIFSAVRAMLDRDRSVEQTRRKAARALIAERFCTETNMRKYVARWSDGRSRIYCRAQPVAGTGQE